MSRIEKAGLSNDAALHDFLVNEALPGTGIDAGHFFGSFSAIVHDLAPRNRELLAKRDDLQAKIDEWYRENGAPSDLDAYQAFLRQIGYLLPEGDDFTVSTENVDPEIASIAGPQLVVPVMNARYALNAANARWGSLYNALYGTDAIPEDDGAEKGKGYNPKRGEKVIAWARAFLDDSIPLVEAKWTEVKSFAVENGVLVIRAGDDSVMSMADPAQFVGYLGEAAEPSRLLFRKNGIHTEILIDASTAIGAADPAHISDVQLESAITTIMDCEDSVAAVDAEDKVTVYRNWLGLMRGDLTESFDKGGKTMTRRMADDREWSAPDGTPFTLHGRSVMFVRNVGHLMTTPMIRLPDGSEAPEGLCDAVITSL